MVFSFFLFKASGAGSSIGATTRSLSELALRGRDARRIGNYEIKETLGIGMAGK